MKNMTRALGYRVLGSLKNESVIVSITPGANLVSLINAKTGKPFAAISEEASTSQYYVATKNGDYGWHSSFAGAINAIKAEPTYPTARERGTQRIKAARRAPKYTGVSMGSFAPGASL